MFPSLLLKAILSAQSTQSAAATATNTTLQMVQLDLFCLLTQRFAKMYGVAVD
jgi:hypothetical protein